MRQRPRNTQEYLSGNSRRVDIIERRGRGRNGPPAGTISMFAGADAPNGYYILNGQAISRVDDADLFELFGTTYGAGDGSTTFNLPNLKGRVPVGQDPAQSEFNVVGETGGAKSHDHDLGDAGYAMIGMGTPGGSARVFMKDSPSSPGDYAATRYVGVTSSSTGDPSGTTSATTAIGGSTASEPALPPYFVINYIIKR